jgi:O-antigen/teichoic acid export membrane protein
LLIWAFLIQSLGYVAVTTLQAIGFPHVPPKFYLVEIPLYAILCTIFIPLWGIGGAALAWLIRILISTAWLMFKTEKSLGTANPWSVFTSLTRPLTWNAGFFVGVYLVARFVHRIEFVGLGIVVFLILYCVTVWVYHLSENERRTFSSIFLRKCGRGIQRSTAGENSV